MQFTCNTCGLIFASADEQRSHMKCDWHRYNLKRRVAQLPAVDEELFNSKVASLSLETESPKEEKKDNKQLTKKEIRRREKEAIYEQKKKILEMARQNMLAQQGQISTIQSEEPKQEVETESIEEKDTEDNLLSQEQLEEKLMAKKLSQRVEIPVTTCLFCHPKEGNNFESVDENSNHMFKQHGFYIPEQKFLVDKEGLIRYLGKRLD